MCAKMTPPCILFVEWNPMLVCLQIFEALIKKKKTYFAGAYYFFPKYLMCISLLTMKDINGWLEYVKLIWIDLWSSGRMFYGAMGPNWNLLDPWIRGMSDAKKTRLMSYLLHCTGWNKPKKAYMTSHINLNSTWSLIYWYGIHLETFLVQ